MTEPPDTHEVRETAAPAGLVEVTLYERPGGHLCEAAATRREALAATLPMQLRRVDIESDAELQRRFLLEIPVVAVAGMVVTREPVDLDAVRAAVLRARS